MWSAKSRLVVWSVAVLTAEQHAARENKLTASRVSALMSGDPAKIRDLWHLMIGDPNYVEPDLSDVWPVQLGVATEVLNLRWFSRKHGPISRVGEVVVGTPSWAACTLDAWSVDRGCPVECKHVGGREPLETIIARYAPQTTWQCLVTGAKEYALSVIMGAQEPIVEYLPLDEAYAKELMTRAEQFMAHVENLTPPVAVAAPVIADKIVQMDSPEWKAQAERWRQSWGAAKTAAEAEKALKGMVPADAAKAVGFGVTVTRNRAGSLALREDRK
jgi:hypothetical protein